MRYTNHDTLLLRILAASSLAVAAPTFAQNASSTAPSAGATGANATADTSAASGDSSGLEEVVVTASTGDKTKLRSSLSVTDVSSELVEAMAPRTQAEALRLIPGMIIADTAGAGGNNNFSVRGLPVTTGGAPFISIQEDGLPTVLFGDMQFGNNDYWTRFDVSNTIETVRGGSASTLASQAPGAVINYISDTGTKQGGEFTLSEGLGFQETRATFAVGGPLSDTLRYHVDGFYVVGQGVRDQGNLAENGYQIKANVTKDLPDDKGFVRLYVKLLDDKEPYNAGGPVLVGVSGTQLSNITPYPGFDVRTGTTVGVYNQNFNVLGNSSGTFTNVPDEGIHPKANAFGAELHFTPGDGVVVDDKFRVTKMSGAFAAQFFGLTPTASVIGSTVNNMTVGSLTYATGPNAGQVYTGAFLNNSAQIYTDMSDMGSVANDLSLADKWQTGYGDLSAKGGLFYFDQTIDQDWHPNAEFQALTGSNPAYLNAWTGANGTGQLLTNGGVAGYNTNWGAGTDKTYAMSVADTAPYIDLTWDLHGLQLEGSLRQDFMRVTGWTESGVNTSQGYFYNNTINATCPGGAASCLTTPYVSYTTVDPGTYAPLNYGFNYRAWSLGALYQFNPDTSVFARASRGGKANTDRNTYSGYTNADGSINASGLQKAVDIVLQQEVGAKNRGALFGGNYTVEATLFRNTFGVSNFDLTKGATGTYYENAYRAWGLELEGTYSWENFGLTAQVTYTDSQVTANAQGPSPTTLVSTPVGYLPGGTPKLTYMIAPTYKWQALTGGLVFQGQSEENINGYPTFYTPGQSFVDLFARYDINSNVSVGMHVNNVANSLGLGGGGSKPPAGVSGLTAVGVSAEFGRVITADVTLHW